MVNNPFSTPPTPERRGKFDWMADALCAQIDINMHVRDVTGPAPVEVDDVCNMCTVKPECGEYGTNITQIGTSNVVEAGTYGALNEAERQELRDRRQAAAKALKLAKQTVQITPKKPDNA